MLYEKTITTFIVLIVSMISVFSFAEDQQNPPKNKTTTKIKVYKKPKTNPDIKPIPGITFILECRIDNNEISFVPSFWGEGMSVKITDELGNEWSGFVTTEEQTIFFDGETGFFEIECLTLDGGTFLGSFEL